MTPHDDPAPLPAERAAADRPSAPSGLTTATAAPPSLCSVTRPDVTIAGTQLDEGCGAGAPPSPGAPGSDPAGTIVMRDAVRLPLASVVDVTVTDVPTVTSAIEPLTVLDTSTLLGTATVTEPPRVSTVTLVGETAVTVPMTPRPPKPPGNPPPAAPP